MSPAFFLTRCGCLYDPHERGWTPFHLWPSQVEALGKLERGRLAVILQARADAAKAAWYWKYARADEETGEMPPMPRADRIPSPSEIPGLTVYVPPDRDHHYVIGADPAEGNPQSDESAAVVLDTDTNEQVATLGLRCDPELFAAHLVKLARLYGGAADPGRAKQSRPRRAAGAAGHCVGGVRTRP